MKTKLLLLTSAILIGCTKEEIIEDTCTCTETQYALSNYTYMDAGVIRMGHSQTKIGEKQMPCQEPYEFIANKVKYVLTCKN